MAAIAPVIALPSDFKYVLASIAGVGLLNVYHSLATGGARKRAKIPYPNAYAPAEVASKDEAAFRFNCAQRAHANLIEQFPTYLSFMLVSGVRYPLVTAGLSTIYLAGKIVYGVSYVNAKIGNDGKERLRGTFYSLGFLGLLGTTVLSLYEMLV